MAKDTKERILTKALELFSQRGYEGTSINELMESVGLVKSAMYRNFDSKEDVLRKWVTAVTDNFLKVSGISYKNESTEVYFTKLFTHMEQHKAICLAMYQADLIHIIKEQFDHVFIELHRDEYDDYKSYFLAGGIYNVFLLWLMGGCRERPEELAGRLESILVK